MVDLFTPDEWLRYELGNFAICLAVTLIDSWLREIFARAYFD